MDLCLPLLLSTSVVKNLFLCLVLFLHLYNEKTEIHDL